MEQKIRDYVKSHKLGKILEIKEISNWWKRKRYHVAVMKLRRKEFTVYESGGEIVTVKNIWTGKEYD